MPFFDDKIYKKYVVNDEINKLFMKQVFDIAI